MCSRLSKCALTNNRNQRFGVIRVMPNQITETVTFGTALQIALNCTWTIHWNNAELYIDTAAPIAGKPSLQNSHSRLYWRSVSKTREWISYYRKLSKIRRIKSQNLNNPCLILKLSLPNLLEPGNEDVVGAAPAGDANTTFEWSTTLLLLRCAL